MACGFWCDGHFTQNDYLLFYDYSHSCFYSSLLLLISKAAQNQIVCVCCANYGPNFFLSVMVNSISFHMHKLKQMFRKNITKINRKSPDIFFERLRRRNVITFLSTGNSDRSSTVVMFVGIFISIKQYAGLVMKCIYCIYAAFASNMKLSSHGMHDSQCQPILRSHCALCSDSHQHRTAS